MILRYINSTLFYRAALFGFVFHHERNCIGCFLCLFREKFDRDGNYSEDGS